MKPVVILQHLTADGPAYLHTWLQRNGLAFELFNSELGQDFPRTLQGCRALAVLGGEMSANDPLPSLRDAERLILEAMHSGVPVLGHCLGGQLMARALGAPVTHSSVPEIGWHAIRLLPHDETAGWFGPGDTTTVFQWHYDAFEPPAGAQLLARSDACAQAFSIGPHLAMQFHVELDADKLDAWLAAHDERFFAAASHDTVQTPAEMRQGVAAHVAAQQGLADRIYQRWIDASTA